MFRFVFFCLVAMASSCASGGLSFPDPQRTTTYARDIHDARASLTTLANDVRGNLAAGVSREQTGLELLFAVQQELPSFFADLASKPATVKLTIQGSGSRPVDGPFATLDLQKAELLGRYLEQTRAWGIGDFTALWYAAQAVRADQWKTSDGLLPIVSRIP